MPDGKHRIRQHLSVKKAVYRLVDACAIGSGLWMLLTWYPELNSDATIVSCLVTIGIFSLVAEFFGLYRDWHGMAFERETTCALFTWGATLLVLFTLGKISMYTTELSRTALVTWFAVTPVLSVSGRIMLRGLKRWLVGRGILARGYAIVGINDLGIQLANNVEASPDLGLRFMGYYDDRPDSRTADLPNHLSVRLGNVEDLIDHAKNNRVNVIFITLPMRAEDRIRNLLSKLADTTASVYIVPDLFVFQLMHSRWTDVQGLPAVSVFENPFYGVDGVLKRTVDLLLATIGLALLIVPMVVIAAAVKLSSPGPIFFRQRRYGLDGREISVWKFRTMTVCEDGGNVTQVTKNDVRVTTVGRFLRCTSLDELPQLINVFKGNMSLVGPRPHASAHNESYRGQIEGYMLRHKVKPGITGLAQVNGLRGETDTLEKMQRRVECDHRYIREWSLSLDMRILFRTIFVVFSRQNAY